MRRPAVAVDLGTTHTLAYVSGSGIVLREPSRVVLRDKMGERTVEPLCEGVVADLPATVQHLKEVLYRVLGRRWLQPKPLLVVCLPSGVTAVERRTLEEVCSRAGAYETRIVSEPYAAALGVGLPVEKSVGSMLVDMGGGTCEAEVFSLGRKVCGRSEAIGGRRLDEAVIAMLRAQYGITVTRETAEDLKINLGAAIPTKYPRTMSFIGQNAGGETVSGQVDTDSMCRCMQPLVGRMVGMIRRTLEETPTELACDILVHGMVLTGGTAQLPGIGEVIFRETGVRAVLAERPREAVVLGAGLLAQRWSDGQ